VRCRASGVRLLATYSVGEGIRRRAIFAHCGGGKIDRMLSKRSSKSTALLDVSIFGLAVAGTAIGALAIGALAIGALGINRLGMGTARIEELSIGKLTVDELVVKRRRDEPR
jgi:hypothetical protein